jgi:prepilin-type N-terminal cleavage/methylation domain-containing protein
MKKEKHKKSRRQKGFSLIELLTVIGIIVIISGIAVMIFGKSRTQFARQNVARELKSAFERARFDSVKRRAEIVNIGGTDVDQRARVVITVDSFNLITDVKNNGTYTQANNTFGGQNISISNNKFGGGTLSFPLTVAFNIRGEAFVTDSTGALINDSIYALRLLVCNGTCNFNNATTANSNLVLLTPTGTVNLLAGNAAIPDFDAPDVTDIDDGSLINRLVSLIAGTPTPVPTPTPTLTPTVTPTVSPTVSPTATPTISPTATPTISPTATPTVSPTAMPTVSPTATPTPPTPTPTPVGCWLSAPDSVVFPKITNGNATGNVIFTYNNATGNAITLTDAGSVSITGQKSFNTLTSTGSHTISIKYGAGILTGSVTISGCGTAKTIGISTN